MANLTILRRYASKADPSSLPQSVLFTHTSTSLTIFDLYPKSNSFHFLLLPRVTSTSTEENTTNLRSLLTWDKAKAKDCLESLAKDAEDIKSMIKQEMIKRNGFEWPIFTGFHAIRDNLWSTFHDLLTLAKLLIFIDRHLHLHIIASDLFSDKLKHKKHYNSFHPKLGFFLHLDEVLSWFDATPSYYESMSKLSKSHYEAMLKEDLVCWRCDKFFKTVPTLKDHLRQEWENDASKAKARKRKREAMENSEGASSSRKLLREG